ncbi:ABC transporter ATP-binding protein [Actinomycetota bacterium]|nr:ABC transporter ATP-binding protein [Actinomycetota bacterium]
MSNIAFRFQNVSIERGERLVWSQGNLEVQKGTITAILGSNGAGKTTLVQLILGVLKPTTGKIEVFESAIGYVPQKYDTDNDNAIRGIDYIELGGIGLPKKHLKECVEQAIEAVAAKDFVHQRLSTLSGGQRQRIAIAQALVDENSLLILDEPLSSLDLDSAREIVGLIKYLNDKFNLTILVVAHDLGLLLPILTGAIYLVDGHAHYCALDDEEHNDYSDLLKHLSTQKVGEHSV